MSDQPPANPNPQYPQYPQYQYGQPIAYGTYNPYAPQTPTSTWCKVAAVVQIVIGGLIGLMAFCLLAATALLAAGALPPEQQAELQTMTELGDGVKILLLVMGACFAIPAIVYVILGIFIWRRATGAIITSLILTGCLLLLNVGNAVYLGASGQAQTLEPLCIHGLGTITLAALLVFLVLALRDVRRGKSEQAALYQQWQQYYQAQYHAQAGQQAPPPVAPAQPTPPGDTSSSPPQQPPLQP